MNTFTRRTDGTGRTCDLVLTSYMAIKLNGMAFISYLHGYNCRFYFDLGQRVLWHSLVLLRQ